MISKGLLALALAVPVLAWGATPIPRNPSLNNGDVTPLRFQGDGLTVRLQFHDDPEAECGKAERPYVRFGCAWWAWGTPHIAIGNPCHFQHENYARRLCHEMGHINGWPPLHGD